MTGGLLDATVTGGYVEELLEYEDNDDLWDKLSNYLGCYCYRDDNYSLTDWDSLIDRWENEPNY